MQHQTTKACLITNPKSGQGSLDLSDALTLLQAQGWEITLRQKLEGGDATDLAREAVRQGCHVVVDCGGDGTLNEIVEGVLGSEIAVGTLPGGTANVWAHETGISQRLDIAARQLATAERRRVDVGVVTVNGKHKSYFLLMAGLGFDGAVIGNLSKRLKHRIGKLAYAPAIVKAVRSFNPLPVRIEMDGLHWQGRVLQIIAGNSRRYADVTELTPDAYIDDGLLDVCLITASGPLTASHQLSSLLLHQHPNEASAEQYRVATMTVYAPDVLPLQVDGGHVQLSDDDVTADGIVFTFSLIAQGVCMLVPRTYGGTLFQPQHLVDTFGKNGSHTSLVTEVTPDRLAGPKDNHHVNSNHNGNGKQKPHEKTWRLRVLAVGINTITARRVKNGKEVHVAITGDTIVADKKGTDLIAADSLATLSTGDIIDVEGVKGDQGAFAANRVRMRRLAPVQK